MSGAFDASMSAAVVPRPARPIGVRASVAAKSVWVTLSISWPEVAYHSVMRGSFRFGPFETTRRPARLRTALVAAVLLVSAPAPSFAWGTEAHRYIMRRAIDLLPPELKPFFVQHRDEIVLRVIDPDLWRNVGWPEDPNHFLDFGAKEYGAYPFKELPRDYGAALEKFGKDTIDRNGTLPWRAQEVFGNLRRAFESMGRSGTYASSDIVVFSAVLSHYVQDAHQPLHATINYDGGDTGQRGIHSRFERDLFERYQSKLSVNPVPPRPITAPRDAAFETLLSSFRLVSPLLEADKKAVAGRESYDDKYFEAFFAHIKGVMEQQLAGAVTATASFILSAWEQAGKPVLRLSAAPRPPQRVTPGR